MNVAKGRQIVLALLALVLLALFGVRLLKVAVAFGLHLVLVGVVLALAIAGYFRIRSAMSRSRDRRQER